ncbi:hypothetical protein EV178_000493 [Coemansia sp. RSA 1646]|nr:hypothetical protein EV178_000493 [Coemansia sp. RSA 1646]
MDFMFQGAITTANTMYVTSNFLQRPTFETVQMRNSGFDTQDSTAPYGVLRQQYSAPSNLEHTIFPFAETIPVYDYTSDDPEEKAQRDTIAGFCNMLKMLRAVLLQDMAILFDVPFYRRMLQGNALMCSETFQRSDFMEFSEQLRNKAWDSDFLPLVNLTPKHPILARPADGFAAAKKRRISEQFPNDIGSSKSNNSESTVFADGPTVPDILNNSNSTNPVTGGCLVVAGRVDPSARQKKPLGSQQAPFDIVYDEGIEKENSIGAVNGSRNIVEAALAAAMPADNWHDRSSLVGEDFGLSGINTACIRQENSQGSGNMEKEEYYSDIWNEELEESESEYDGDITAISSKNMEDIISSRDNSSNPRIHPMQKTRLPDKTSKRGMILFEYMNCVLTKDHVERQASNIITIQDDLSSIKLLMKEIVSNQYDLKAAVSSASNELASEILPQINGLHGMLEKLNSGIEDVQGLLEAIRSSK